ncbi:MAG: hypothetical protein CM1200mP39_18810 [Dehalococcoidia bacterium]|nr:MAG: hypothetical protein CM1200mP39_18810 [Dehalococcoidia bacterium]
MAARAKTLRFLPHRADLKTDTPTEKTHLSMLLWANVVQGMSWWQIYRVVHKDVVAGDVKLLQLKMNNADGVVIDGAYAISTFSETRNMDSSFTLQPAVFMVVQP